MSALDSTAADSTAVYSSSPAEATSATTDSVAEGGGSKFTTSLDSEGAPRAPANSVVDDERGRCPEVQGFRTNYPQKQIRTPEALKPYLGQIMRVELEDGRVIIGTLVCTDREANLIFEDATEFWQQHGPEGPVRVLGIVIVNAIHCKSFKMRKPTGTEETVSSKDDSGELKSAKSD